MHLPINVDDVLHGQTVEWERLEFKQGWNPEAVLHTMCAFANDFHNFGGGYILIGVAENQGQPLLPPAGLPASKLDDMQKEILEIGHRMQPYYHPVIAPYLVQQKHILVLWCPGGQTRPYKAPVSLAKGNRESERRGRRLAKQHDHFYAQENRCSGDCPLGQRGVKLVQRPAGGGDVVSVSVESA